MSSQYPSNQAWGNRNNGPGLGARHDIPLGVNGGVAQEYTTNPHQVPWQDHGMGVSHQALQHTGQHMASQPMYAPSHQHQQTYWNNNMVQKPLQPVYAPDRSVSWARQNPPQPQYTPPMPQVPVDSFSNPYPYHPNHPQQHLQQQTVVPGAYRPQPQPAQFSPALQPNVSTMPVPQRSEDSWGWGWDESGSNSPATNNNLHNDTWNWNVEEEEQAVQQYVGPPNPVQSYFQGGVSAVVQENIEIKPEEQTEIGAISETAEDIPDPAYDHSHTGDVKSERLTPDSGKIPLTTQALREFHENGQVDLKPRHNAEGLTPQWSIESQMSQDTGSDDISPSVQGGSLSDLDTRPSTVSQSPLSTQQDHHWHEYPPSGESAPDTSPKSPLANLAPPQRFIGVRNDLYESSLLTTTTSLEGLSIGSQATGDGFCQDVENKEIVSPELKTGLVGPPPFSKPTEQSSANANPYSASRSLTHKYAAGRPAAVPQEAATPSPLLIHQVAHAPQVAAWQPALGVGDESVNLETIPDNKERPDAAENRASQVTHRAPWTGDAENQEVTPRCGPDRNQYLETGQLEEGPGETEAADMSGLSRLVPGEGLPPPGLHRMVPGQQNEADQAVDLDSHLNTESTPPPGLHRMVPGQFTDEPLSTSVEETIDLGTSAGRDDIPPPGLHRMVPGESSSPETQGAGPVGPHREERVVTGVSRDDVLSSTNPPMPVSPIPVNRLTSQPASPEAVARPNAAPQAERSETIGSDNVDDAASTKPSGKSRDKERERRREDVSSDERERGGGRRTRDYNQRDRRDRDGDDSPGEERQRYPDERDGRRAKRERERVDWDRGDRTDRGGERGERRRDYRDDRRRHRDYEYSDEEDADTNGYYSDRDRRNMSNYREEDRTYPRREDRARSLRPEKTRERERNEDRSGKDRRRGGYERERDRDRDRNDFYRRRGHDEVETSGAYQRDSQRSRPSSRNGSVQDFKHRGLTARGYDGDRDRDYRGQHKQNRDPYYQQAGYNYDPSYYNYYYQYYENLRRTNPAAYADYCQKYYAHSQQGTFEGAYTEDRGSVHSGRSSANEETKDRRLDSSLHMEEPAALQRLTPAKFTTAHVKGILTPRGQLIKILAHYPLDGQPATLELHDQLLCCEADRKQLQDFPGPLVKGVTHKNNVLRYCKLKMREADANAELYDKDSCKLIWELLILLIRQNGTVVGTDIAELLLSNRASAGAALPPIATPSPATSQHSLTELGGAATTGQPSVDEVTTQYRDLLMYGNTKEALEWAMRHGLWGHALFLASKMDQRTYASVMTRFANGLTMNDPLQTLYQLMSGRQPASVTCCLDERWGDWRPHLAMILSNQSSRPELDHKAITTLGDTLGSRGSLHAAHFCYLMAQVEFGTYASKSSKMVLIGSSHALSFSKFATNEAIFATEIFEFACSLADPDFSLHHLQVYKLLVARRLTEVGMTQEAVHYVEVVANTVVKHPTQYSVQFIQEVYDLGNMLKMSDPMYTSSEGDQDPEWLVRLFNVISDYQMGVLQHDAIGSVSNLTTYSDNDGVQNLPLDPVSQEMSAGAWQQHQQQVHQQYQSPGSQQQYYEHAEDLSISTHRTAPIYSHLPQPGVDVAPSTDTSHVYNTWSPRTQWAGSGGEAPPQGLGDMSAAASPETMAPELSPPSLYNSYDSSRNEGAAPQITLPSSKPRTVSQSSEERKQSAGGARPKTKKEQVKGAQGNGWFGGLWNKLAMRPKNQMILPDDKDPSIVWDSDKKRWVNLDADENGEGGATFAPPPKASASAPPVPGSANHAPADQSTPQPPQPLGANRYTMGRSKNLRSNYVDVMNPGGPRQTSSPAVPAPDLFPSLNYSTPYAPPQTFFVPPPVEGQDNAPTDFLTPTSPLAQDRHDVGEYSTPQALSRWSSTSSLSREVQKYTINHARVRKFKNGPVGSSTEWNGTPQMYSPGELAPGQAAPLTRMPPRYPK